MPHNQSSLNVMHIALAGLRNTHRTLYTVVMAANKAAASSILHRFVLFTGVGVGVSSLGAASQSHGREESDLTICLDHL